MEFNQTRPKGWALLVWCDSGSRKVCAMLSAMCGTGSLLPVAEPDQGFNFRPDLPNRRPPVPVYRSGLTGYRSEPEEFKFEFKFSRSNGSYRYTGRLDRFTSRFGRYTGDLRIPVYRPVSLVYRPVWPVTGRNRSNSNLNSNFPVQPVRTGIPAG